MNNNKKIGLSRPKTLSLLIQLIIVAAATACTVFVLWFSISHGAGALFTAAYSAILISYVAVIFYASYGYKKDYRYFLGAIYAFCLAIQLNILLPFRTTYQLVTLTLLFGVYIAFAQWLKHKKAAEILLLCMVLTALAFSIYSTVTARTENLAELSTNPLSVTAMYVSIWTPVIMTVTLALAYSVRRDRE
ncbi:MAG: hypothetical protein IJS44_02530 [Clostridia bacterium]|nr:hypothetical protein [Clostridia bacterium]